MGPAADASFEAFLGELRRLTQRFHLLGSRLHGEEALPQPWRTALAALEGSGPLSMPRLARIFAVSRQSMQVTARELEAAGLVRRLANPDHARSHLLDLTDEGRQRLDQLRRKEERALEALGLPLPPERLGQVTQGLRDIRRALEDVIGRLPR